MLHSTYHHKETNEDPKTSAVFENLMLLSDNVFWHLLRQSCFSNDTMPIHSGHLLSYDFWPHWDRTDTDNKIYVEPDLFIRFEMFDVIIEAKYSDTGGQYERQWKQEITAYHNEFGNQKPFVFIAVGGNMSILAETLSLKDERVCIYKCNWLSLLMTVNKYRNELEAISVPDMNVSATMRLLDNIILAFNINGVYNIDWFNTMAESRPIISASSLNNLQELYKW
jgi:hypothetical protein